MPKRSTGSILGLLLLLLPVAWVCHLCTGSDRARPAATTPTREPSAPPAATPVADAPVVPVAPVPEPHPAKHARHGKRSHHDTPEHETAVMPAAPGDATADEIDRALQDALIEPEPEPSRRSASAFDDGSGALCCKHCGPSSQPCGDSCISRSKTCHKGRGCAC